VNGDTNILWLRAIESAGVKIRLELSKCFTNEIADEILMIPIGRETFCQPRKKRPRWENDLA
jgi:hypothetical protein